jgi:two-component system nitrogen regulation sensor histidine kinase GlnL
MSERNLLRFRKRNTTDAMDPAVILSALRSAVVVVDAVDVIRYVNGAAESLFATSAQYLLEQPLTDFLPADSPVMSLVALARDRGVQVYENGITVDTPKTGRRILAITASTMQEAPDKVLLTLSEQSIAARMNALLPSRNAARSAAAMAAMLAHEVKNPLSGIRGAAQLLDLGLSEDERVLSRLIIDETDRIVSLVDRMDVFASDQSAAAGRVNIHAVLGHVKRIAENGFARHVRVREDYDPSLPDVAGNRDQLIQVFLNLVKNAAEAVPSEGGEIVISTAFQHGLRLTSLMANDRRRQLPLVVSIQDNGSGIPDELRPHLFDAFVTTKPAGSGLGLALAAKIVDDHGGFIECESQPRRTVFRVMLPLALEPSGQ